MNEKTLLWIAQKISWFFTPFLVPTLGVALLFTFSYLRVMPLSYKFLITVAVFCFTIMMPQCTIFFYRRMNGWSLRELGRREKRFVPYILSIASYLFCLSMLYRFRVPSCMTGIVVASLIAMVVAILLNYWWKLSEHMISVGGVVGGLVCFGELFVFNPIGWICLTIIVGGMVGTSRMTLRQHNLSQIIGGFILGMASSVVGILYGQKIIDYILS